MLCWIGQEDIDTYLESILLAERRVGIKYAQRGVEERLQGMLMCNLYTITYLKTQQSMLLIFVQLSFCSVSQLELSPGNRTQWGGREFVT